MLNDQSSPVLASVGRKSDFTGRYLTMWLLHRKLLKWVTDVANKGWNISQRLGHNTYCQLHHTTWDTFINSLWAYNLKLAKIWIVLLWKVIIWSGCTCHDDWAVVTCVQQWSDWIIRIIIKAKRFLEYFNYEFITIWEMGTSPHTRPHSHCRIMETDFIIMVWMAQYL